MASKDKDKQEQNVEELKELPIIPVPGDLVIFPYMPPVPPFPPHYVVLSGENVTSAVDEALIDGSRLLCIFKRQSDKDTAELTVEDFNIVGTQIYIIKCRKEDNNVLFLAQGRARVQIEEITQTDPFVKGRVRIIEEKEEEKTVEVEALMRSATSLFQKIVELSSRYQEEFSIIADNVDEPGRLADYIGAILDLKPEDKQVLLETISPTDRLAQLMVSLTKELDLLELESKIQSDAQGVINQGQREYFLREQIEKANMPEKVHAVAEKELNRLSKMHSASPESTVSRNYLDWLINLPWDVSTLDRLDLPHAKEILDEDHYDLEKVKDRILEYLAVCMLKEDMKGPILCFVGPPGVGKTSLGASIARAMERKFVRVSLGGVHDEAEIRGHRRTYIGSMPGRIVKSLRQVESNNPVFMLDEVDKLGSDFRGDPAAALLEVLDPEQNFAFVDNYLEVSFDLSKVMFITTANQLHTIPPALLDRLEILELPGYTANEKLMIAKQYLIPRQLEAHGIGVVALSIADEAIHQVIDKYTREAGVRNLEREIGTICRKVARQIAEGKDTSTHVTVDDVPDYLGLTKFYSEIAERQEEIGVVTGMSATAYGGEILFIEATSMAGEGRLLLTGQLGDVMQESAQTALSYVKSQSGALHFDPDFFQKHDIHVHVPAGANPKDGPSAGITIATALASLATKYSVIPEVAMTGEVTLRGRVLPIGGLKEKTLAAKQAGIKTVILPERNRKDLVEIPDDAKEGLEFILVDHVNEVLDRALKHGN